MEKLSDRRLNILSFGCSTGEECLTLAEYFPSATILGVDTDEGLLTICKQKNTYPNVSFVISSSENIKKRGPFDIIFCMSVLCRWGADSNEVTAYSLPKFQRIIGELDKFLAKYGLLVIYNSSFRFSDSSIYYKYKVLYDPEIDSGFVTMFDKDHNIMSRPLYKDCIFIKMIE
jgi:chemotaxis methyl-accepting protein methylase